MRRFMVVMVAVAAMVGSSVRGDTVQYQIAGNYDDTTASSDNNAVTNDYMFFPYNSDTLRQPFYRWQVSVPAGATIESAYLKVRAGATRAVDTSIRLWLLDYDDCATFYNNNPFGSPLVTGTDVDWTLPYFTAGAWYTSPDIKTLVQAFVDRPGYTPGNYLGMRGQWLSGLYRYVYQRDGDANSGAILEITYSMVQDETEVEYQIAGGNDDTHCTSTSNYVGNDTMYCPYSSDAARRPFFRWAINIPPGATIQSASLELKASSTRAVDTSMRLWLLDYDSCPSFSTNPFASAMVAGTDVDWAMPHFAGGTWYTSPDITDIVQEFIDREGYEPGNYLGIRGQWLSGSYRLVYQYDNHPDDGAVLSISYSGGNFAPVADAGSDQAVTDINDDGYETVSLDASASSDSDGTIAGYVWTEGETQIATGETPNVSLAVGMHTITLTVTDDDSETDTDTVVITVRGPKYYIDYASGSDTNNGTSTTTPWKHCPGDANATGVPAGFNLLPGDTVIFKGGVTYKGSITCSVSGLSGLPLVYDGNSAGTWGTGPAIFDGSETISNWTQCSSAAEAGGNPNYANIWYAYAPANSNANTSNLYQNDGDENLCWMAQDPNQGEPFFMNSINGFHSIDCDDVTITSLTDSARLTQATSDYWDGAFVMVWRIPNLVDARAITSFDPSTDTITYDALGNQPYDDRDGKYAIFNHISLIDEAGEYYFNDTAEGDGTHKVWLWPPAGNPNTNPVSFSAASVRHSAFILTNNLSYVTFKGIRMQKYAGGRSYGGLYGGAGINSNASGGLSHITIQDCEFKYFRHDVRDQDGYGAVTLSGTDHLIDGNVFIDVALTNAMQCSLTDSVVSYNYVERPGRHGLWMNFNNCRIVGNVMTDVRGPHADGIAIFNGSSNVEVIGNTIVNSSVPICTKASSNVTVAYNMLHCPSFYAYADYGSCTNLKIYNNTLIRDDDKPSLRNDSGGEMKNNIRYTVSGSGSLTPDANGNLTINHSMDSSVFADAANGDYSLAANSPAIDAGLDLDYGCDIEGEDVPSGDGPDAGCYEYQQ